LYGDLAAGTTPSSTSVQPLESAQLPGGVRRHAVALGILWSALAHSPSSRANLRGGELEVCPRRRGASWSEGRLHPEPAPWPRRARNRCRACARLATAFDELSPAIW